MSEINTNWMQALKDDLQANEIPVDIIEGTNLQWLISSEHWGRFAEQAKQHTLRWCAGWGEQIDDGFRLNACLEKQGNYLWLRTTVNAKKPELPSQAPFFPSASRSERHTQDMFGVQFTDHPDSRPWLRHQAWQKHQYPLRKDFPLQGELDAEVITPADLDYSFIKARGSGVYEIPVGPVHAGIIEPGHFRFQAIGETVLNLEQRLGYVHKGIEKLAEGREPEALARLAGRISGDTSVAHCWAACQAMEQATELSIPTRAVFIRAIMCERERIANHLGDVGAICNDVGFAFAQMQFSRLREQWQRNQAQLFGHRFMMDCIVPGGVNSDLSETAYQFINEELISLRKELDEIVPALDLNSSLEDRLLTAGFLSEQTAQNYGAVGYVGRASGQGGDVRDQPSYAPYDQLHFKVALETQGDIASRFWIRIKEIFASIKLIQQMIDKLPSGEIKSQWKAPDKSCEGLAMIEAWRGEIVSYVRLDDNNRIERFYARDPSAINWPTLERIVLNNIVPDFPVCNKSVNGSYSGHDL